jgi:hypothetical protein
LKKEPTGDEMYNYSFQKWVRFEKVGIVYKYSWNKWALNEKCTITVQKIGAVMIWKVALVLIQSKNGRRMKSLPVDIEK